MWQIFSYRYGKMAGPAGDSFLGCGGRGPLAADLSAGKGGEKERGEGCRSGQLAEPKRSIRQWSNRKRSI